MAGCSPLEPGSLAHVTHVGGRTFGRLGDEAFCAEEPERRIDRGISLLEREKLVLRVFLRHGFNERTVLVLLDDLASDIRLREERRRPVAEREPLLLLSLLRTGD